MVAKQTTTTTKNKREERERPSRMGQIKNANRIKFWKGCRTTKILIYCWEKNKGRDILGNSLTLL